MAVKTGVKKTRSAASLIAASLLGSLFLQQAASGAQAATVPMCEGSELSHAEASALRQKIAATLHENAGTFFDNSEVLVSVGGLRRQHRDALVYLADSNYCGTGGCTVLIFSSPTNRKRQVGSFSYVGRIHQVHAPIGTLANSHDGWRDLAVSVAGGGIRSAHLARMTFSRGRYPSNASTIVDSEVTIDHSQAAPGECRLTN